MDKSKHTGRARVRNAVRYFTAVLALAVAMPATAQSCLGDLNADRTVTGADIGSLLDQWGQAGSADLNGDGIVGGADLGLLLEFWGACPPVMVPSWATLVEEEPNPAVVTDATLRAAIIASGLAWRVRDTATQIEMLLIPAGRFTMGCTAPNQWGCLGDENPTRSVTLTQSFYMGRYEVTQSQWVAKMSSNPSRFQAYSDSARRPVESVSWNAIQGFLSATDMRLPSQAEWQYACWAVTTTALNNGSSHYATAGNIVWHCYGSSDDATAGSISWHWENSGSQTHAVGGKAANALGLHDILGNVWEWGNDWHDGNFYELNPSTKTREPVPTRFRVSLGNSFSSEADEVRFSLRKAIFSPPDWTDDDLGFRVARNP